MALRLRLLGGIEITRDGVPLALPASRKTRALLAYLAATGRPHRRDRLCAIFWDVPDDPRGALRWSLSKLRSVMEHAGRPPIVADRETVSIESGSIDVDLLEARRSLTRATAAIPDAELEATAALFRGELLEGLELSNCPEFETWLAAEREEARGMHRQIRTQLVARYADRPVEALPHARALAAIDPDHVDSHLRLLKLLVAADRPQEAEEQLEASSRILLQISDAAARDLSMAWRLVRRPTYEPSTQPAIATPRQPAASSAAQETETSAVNESARRPTIAVMPFVNMGADPDEDYFSRGISDEIAAGLAHFAELTVLAPSTTSRVKDSRVSMPELAERLHADYLLDGVVVRAGQRVRMTIQLIDGKTGADVWADRYDRLLDDIFAVQDEIARVVTASLSVRLRDTNLQLSLKKRPRDLTAYDLMLRARRYVWVLTPEEHARARDCLEEALRRDPDYADALASLVYVYASEYSHGHNPRPNSLERAMAAGRRAVELDPSNARAHAALALTHFFRRDHAIFVNEAERALVLNPNDPEMAGTLGAYLVYSGHYERGIALLNEAMQLNPLHPTWYHYSFVVWHVDRNEIREALRRISMVDMADFHWSLILRTACLALDGRLDEAVVTWKRFRMLNPDFDVGELLVRWIRSETYIERIMSGIARTEEAIRKG